MNRASAENNVVSFSSYAERSTRKAGAASLLSKARVAFAQGQKEAFLAELAGCVDEVLGNRALAIQEASAGGLSRAHYRPVPRLRLLPGGKR